MFRHGDVLVIPVQSIPANAKKEPRKGDVILAHGEVTGHAHRIKEKTAKVFNLDGQRYLVLEKPSALTHEEHREINLPAGAYEIRIQVEYRPEAIQRVVD